MLVLSYLLFRLVLSCLVLFSLSSFLVSLFLLSCLLFSLSLLFSFVLSCLVFRLPSFIFSCLFLSVSPGLCLRVMLSVMLSVLLCVGVHVVWSVVCVGVTCRRTGVSSSVLLTKIRMAHAEFSLGTREVHQRTPWIFPFSGLRTGREQHVPDSSNHSLYLIKLFNSSSSVGHCGGNQLSDGSVCISPISPSRTNDLHVSIATPPGFALALRFSGLVHHLSGPDKTKNTLYMNITFTFTCICVYFFKKKNLYINMLS